MLDQLDGAAEHAGLHINFAVVAKTSLPRLVTFANERGWRRLRLLSSTGNTYNRDYHGETAEGVQRPMLNVFHRDGDTILHFWGAARDDAGSAGRKLLPSQVAITRNACFWHGLARAGAEGR